VCTEPVSSTDEENADGQAGAIGMEVPYRVYDAHAEGYADTARPRARSSTASCTTENPGRLS
jgi:hypothetical protein